jgi:hypothetical protein
MPFRLFWGPLEKPNEVPTPEMAEIARGAGIIFLGTLAGNALRYLFQALVAHP